MSASDDPIGAELVYDRLMPLYGSPMLSMTLTISFDGMISRIALCTRSHSAAVSSMRVPVGARRCSLNWPLSTDGKQSSPTQRTSPSEANQAAQHQSPNT